MPGHLSERDLIDCGFIPGMPGLVIGPFDKRERFIPPEDQPDDIWEEEEGIKSRYQASTLLITEPLLWGPYLDFRLSGHELSKCELHDMSFFEVSAILEQAHARNRKLFPKKAGTNG